MYTLRLCRSLPQALLVCACAQGQNLQLRGNEGREGGFIDNCADGVQGNDPVFPFGIDSRDGKGLIKRKDKIVPNCGGLVLRIHSTGVSREEVFSCLPLQKSRCMGRSRRFLGEAHLFCERLR